MATDECLSPEQQREAQQIYEAVEAELLDQLRQTCRMLAQTEDDQLLGQTEFELRDRAHQMVTQVLQRTLEARKKKATRDRA